MRPPVTAKGELKEFARMSGGGARHMDGLTRARYVAICIGVHDSITAVIRGVFKMSVLIPLERSFG
jgi:hypothetical protein